MMMMNVDSFFVETMKFPECLVPAIESDRISLQSFPSSFICLFSTPFNQLQQEYT